jgi:S-(hydroxymethyl)glutathione dehydrogenase/alcohol dehydrogenase
MRAAVLFNTAGRLDIEDVIVDSPGPHEVLVRLAATGLCHSDLHHIEQPASLPIPAVLGHEAAGIVEAVGDDVTYVGVGDHVVSAPRAFCGQCEWCLSGRATLCGQEPLTRGEDEIPRVRLLDGRGCFQLGGLGGFAEQMLVHENKLVKIDKDIPLDRAALVGCGVITGAGAVLRTAKVPPGANVAVVGCGGVGLNCVQGALIAGANRIVAIDIDDDKLSLAQVLGATDTINSSSVDPMVELPDLLPGAGGVDYSFEALGRRATIELAFALLRPGGTATVTGLLDGPFQISGRHLLLERRIQGSMLGSVNIRRDIPYFLDLYQAGRLKLDELISSRLGLDEINAGFSALAQGAGARSVVLFS